MKVSVVAHFIFCFNGDGLVRSRVDNFVQVIISRLPLLHDSYQTIETRVAAISQAVTEAPM